MNPEAAAIDDPVLRNDASSPPRSTSAKSIEAPEDVLNRILWRAMRGSRDPYPEWAITAVDDEDDD